MTQVLSLEAVSRQSFLDSLASTLAVDAGGVATTLSDEAQQLALVIRALRGIEGQAPGTLAAIQHQAKHVDEQPFSQSANYQDLAQHAAAAVVGFATTYALHARNIAALSTDLKDFDGVCTDLLNDARLNNAARRNLLRPAVLACAQSLLKDIPVDAVRQRAAGAMTKESLNQYSRVLPISALERDSGVTVRSPQKPHEKPKLVAPAIERHNPGGIMMERLR